MNDLQEILFEIRLHIIAEEGFQRYHYNCPAGYVTIGHGLNTGTITELELKIINDHRKDYKKPIKVLDDLSYITKEESGLIVGFRVEQLFNYFMEKTKWFRHLNRCRKKVVIDMAFNMGIKKFNGFKNTIAALEIQDYSKAYCEILDSDYYRNSYSIKYSYNRRADLNANRMRYGHCRGKEYSND